MNLQRSKNGSNCVCEKGTFSQIRSHILNTKSEPKRLGLEMFLLDTDDRSYSIVQSLQRILISMLIAILSRSYQGGCLFGLISSQFSLNHHPDFVITAQFTAVCRSLVLTKIVNILICKDCFASVKLSLSIPVYPPTVNLYSSLALPTLNWL